MGDLGAVGPRHDPDLFQIKLQKVSRPAKIAVGPSLDRITVEAVHEHNVCDDCFARLSGVENVHCRNAIFESGQVGSLLRERKFIDSVLEQMTIQIVL